MKQVFRLFVTGVILMFAASCVDGIIDSGKNTSDSLHTIVVQIDDENATKATLAEADGAFAFSSGDKIKIYNGTALGTASTTSTTNVAQFTLEDPEYTEGTSGFVAFPASLVSDITGSGVTFILPASYDYSEVGGADPSTAKVPCPMMGTYVAGDVTVLKQAGALVRFKVTNIAAGSLTFNFPTLVSGKVIVSATPSGDGDGILVTNFTKETVDPKVAAGSKSITVHGVPAVASGSYIYITLPVPTNTVPDNILVTNDPTVAATTPVRMASFSKTPTPSALKRAYGYKIGLTLDEIPEASFTIDGSGNKVVLAPGNLMAKIGSLDGHTAEASEWKFGGYYEIVGQSETEGNHLFYNESTACIGKWVDLFLWQGSNATVKAHGLLRGFDRGNISGKQYAVEPGITSTVEQAENLDKMYFGFTEGETIYDGCWNTGAGGISISNGGTYDWRPLTYQEWDYILNGRGDADDYRFARATVAGVNGLLIFPDGTSSWKAAWGFDPNEASGDKNGKAGDTHKYPDYNYNFGAYTATQMITMAEDGVVFMPCTGYASYHSVRQSQLWGYYWTATGSYSNNEHNNKVWAYYLNFNVAQNVTAAQYFREVGRAVRLARDI